MKCLSGITRYLKHFSVIAACTFGLMSIIASGGSSNHENFTTIPGNIETGISSKFENLVKPPVLVYPSDDKTVQEQAINLKWKAVEGAEIYRLVVSLNSDLSSHVIDITTTDTEYPLFDLYYGMTYFWRVCAYSDDKNNNSISKIWSFATPSSSVPAIPICIVESPILLSPEDGESIQQNEFNLEWESTEGADSYHVVVSLTSDLENPVVDIMTSDTTFTLSDLAEATNYYWVVDVYDADTDLEISSEIRTFSFQN